MNAGEAYARLVALSIPVLRTSDAAAAWRSTPGAATKTLTRLARSGLVTKLRSGVWVLRGASLDRYSLVDHLTAPFPSYVSLQTGLYLRGLIDQVPEEVYIVSLARRQRIRTTMAVYSVHHIEPGLFTGFDVKDSGAKLATAEKALFDMVYFSGARTRLFSRVPELELPRGFRWSLLGEWCQRIRSVRRRSMVARRLGALQQRTIRS